MDSSAPTILRSRVRINQGAFALKEVTYVTDNFRFQQKAKSFHKIDLIFFVKQNTLAFLESGENLDSQTIKIVVYT